LLARKDKNHKAEKKIKIKLLKNKNLKL